MSTGMFNVPIISEKCLTILGGKLLKAAEDGDNSQVEYLLNKGASFTTDSVGTSALHLACRNGHSSTAEFLIRAGISTNIRTKMNKTPLHISSQFGHYNIVEVLLNHHADVNAVDMLQMSPLHWAVEGKFLNIVKLLMANNADINMKNKFGKSPLDIARVKCGEKFVDCLNKEVEDEDESRNKQSKESPLVENLGNLSTSMKQDLMLPWLQTSSSSSDHMTSSLDVTSSKFLDGTSMVMLTEAGKRILRCFNQQQTNKMNQQRCFITNNNDDGNMASQYDDDVTSDDDDVITNSKRKHIEEDEKNEISSHKRKRRKVDDVILSSSSDDDVTLTDDMMTSSLVRYGKDMDIERWKEQLNLLQQQFTSSNDDVTNT